MNKNKPVKKAVVFGVTRTVDFSTGVRVQWKFIEWVSG